MKFLKEKENKGFTLIETLVAVSIFSIAVVTMLVVLSRGLTSTIYAKQKAGAVYLAQEGIEYMRNMRDTYVLYSSSPQVGWTAFLNTKVLPVCNSALFSGGCYFNADSVFSLGSTMPITQIPLTTCVSSCPNLLYDSANGKYGYTSGVASGYVRKISVTQITTDEVKVSSTVYWTQGSGTYSTTLSEDLFNWAE